MIPFVAGGVATMLLHVCSAKCVKQFICPCSKHTKLTANSERTVAPMMAYITLVRL